MPAVPLALTSGACSTVVLVCQERCDHVLLSTMVQLLTTKVTMTYNDQSGHEGEDKKDYTRKMMIFHAFHCVSVVAQLKVLDPRTFIQNCAGMFLKVFEWFGRVLAVGY